VIFAGGLGTRLGSLTEREPKPMVRVAGTPFIDHLLDLLRGQGIDRVALLLGHRAEVLADHVGTGARWGLAVEHLVTPPQVQTLTRLRAAEPALDDVALLAYCDNYVPLDLPAMWASHQTGGAAVQVTAYANDDGFTRSNMRVDLDGLVRAYDPARTADGLNRVDLGFAIIDRRRLGRLPDGDVPFEHAVYPQLVRSGTLRAWVTPHRYYGVGSLPRLPAADRFFARRPAVILDRDGVLNRSAGKGDYVRDPADLVWLDGALEALRLLNTAGFRVFVATNQAGVARGLMTGQQLDAVHRRLVEDAAAAGGRIDAVYSCVHGWNDDCACRKPAPGLLLQAQREHDLDLSRTVFVGDDERDEQAARAAGCPFRPVRPDRPLLCIARELTAAA
jgi:D-glycero-D-manno-heptose 1,7-bisphosphate phosphatase